MPAISKTLASLTRQADRPEASPTLRQLASFVDVADLGSFSAAALRQGLTQPAISLQMRQLEAALGLPLLERVGRRVRPSPAGAELLPHARRLQADLAEALRALAPHRSGQLGRVRIGTGATACIHLLPGPLGRLRQRLPGLEIVVETGNTGDMLRRLEDNALDIALVTLPARGRQLQVSRLFDDELVAVAPPGTTVPTRGVGAALLAAQPLILYDAGGHTRLAIDRWLARAGVVVRPVMALSSVEAMKPLVAAGLGWSVLPRMAVARDDPAAPGLVVAPLAPRLRRTLGLVMRRDKPLGRGLQAVVAALRDAGAHGAGDPAAATAHRAARTVAPPGTPELVRPPFAPPKDGPGRHTR